MRTVVDLGAGTGALSRLLVGRADEVVAVEPDDRMRAVLAEAVPGARALAGRGEAIPLPDASVDAVMASSSWHWMDTVPTLLEVGRVLVPGGTLAARVVGARPRHRPHRAGAGAPQRRRGPGPGAVELDDQSQAELSAAMNDRNASDPGARDPAGCPLRPARADGVTWDVALTADELIGLLGTFSWVILMEDDARERLFDTAGGSCATRSGSSGDVTVDVGYRAEVFKARRHD